MTTPAPGDVRVRFEIPTLGHSWRDEVTVTRTPLVEALLERGALTLLEDPAGNPASDPQAGGGPVGVGETPTGAAAAGTGWFAPPAAD